MQVDSLNGPLLVRFFSINLNLGVVVPAGVERVAINMASPVSGWTEIVRWSGITGLVVLLGLIKRRFPGRKNGG